MKKNFLLAGFIIISASSLRAQVTQINSNSSLHVQAPLNNTKTILRSDIDSTIWVTDGSPGGTIQLSSVIKYSGGFNGLLSGQLIFEGSVAATGAELYITNGTPGGTMLVSDINPGAASSAPDDFVLLNGFIYFTASRPAEGRELWRTDGTPGGTSLVKDIEAGPTGSFSGNDGFHLFSNGTFLLFSANTAASGNELWQSDGSNGGTILLKEINTGNSNADSSNPNNFYVHNGLVLFTAKDATHGIEVWATDGSPGGTILLQDINPGTGNCTGFELFPGFEIPVFLSFHTFNNRVYFNAFDGVSTGEIWGTDGTPVNTSLLKNIVPGTSLSIVAVVDAENLPTKFIFPVSDGVSRSELWESDGTPGGTILFKAFSPINPSDFPIVFASYSINPATGTISYPLFQGDKFFFMAGTSTEGNELWITDGVDGTPAHTHIVKDINSGTGNGVDPSLALSYLYTSTTLFFAATDGILGDELWKTDGTSSGTTLIQDIYLNAGDANPELSPFIVNSKVIFSATDGDSPTATDLFAVDGNFVSAPIKLRDFTVTLKSNDAILAWSTEEELNTKNFSIQRSYNAQIFKDIGTVAAAGNSSTRHAYQFTDAGVMNSGKNLVYYRLLTTDNDGKSAFSKVISLKLKGNSPWNLSLLSNPVGDNITLILSGVNGQVNLSIYDMNGKTVYAKSVQNTNGQIRLPVSLQKGVYILEAENKNERKTIKFIKQ